MQIAMLNASTIQHFHDLTITFATALTCPPFDYGERHVA